MLEELKATVRDYQNVFGEHSLDNVVLLDPLRINDESVAQAVNQLKSALDKGQPLDNTPPDITPIY